MCKFVRNLAMPAVARSLADGERLAYQKLKPNVKKSLYQEAEWSSSSLMILI